MSVYIIRIKPSSKKGALVQPALDGSLLVYVREPAVEGKANKAMTELLADYFDVPKTNIQILSGQKARIKRVEVTA